MFKKVVAAVEIVALLAAGGFVVMLAFAGPSNSAPTGGAGGGSDAYLPETGALPAGGRALYAVRCAGCHGSAGGGGSGPRLAGRVTEEFPDIEDEIVVVTKGRGGMPGFGSSLDEAEIRAVVEFTRTDLGS